MIPEAIEGEEPTVKLAPEPEKPYRSQEILVDAVDGLRSAVTAMQAGNLSAAVREVCRAECMRGLLGMNHHGRPSYERFATMTCRVSLAVSDAVWDLQRAASRATEATP